MDLLVEAALRQAAGRPGCPLCRVGEEAAERYLRSVLHEGVNDGATRSRLDRSCGFCRRHAWHFLGMEWESMHDSLGMATLAEGLVEAAEQTLDAFLDGVPSQPRKGAARVPLEELARTLAPTEPCPACQAQADHESYATTVLVRALEDPGWREHLAASDGLCVPHFRHAILTETTPERVQWVIEEQRRRLRELRVELAEYGRKHDYRFREERYGREVSAAVRAAEVLAGSWFELPRRPRIEAEHEPGVAPAEKEDERHG